MSAVPEDFTRNRADQAGREAGQSRPPADDTGTPSIWQWLALGVLLACWLAEAALCAARAP